MIACVCLALSVFFDAQAQGAMKLTISNITYLVRAMIIPIRGDNTVLTLILSPTNDPQNSFPFMYETEINNTNELSELGLNKNNTIKDFWKAYIKTNCAEFN